jgi:hypothetical protein
MSFKEFHFEKLQPSMNDLVRYMLKQTQDEDEKVALEACEFWMALAEQQECMTLVQTRFMFACRCPSTRTLPQPPDPCSYQRDAIFRDRRHGAKRRRGKNGGDSCFEQIAKFLFRCFAVSAVSSETTKQ